MQIKDGQTHSDADRMNKLELQIRIYSKVLKMCFRIWNVYYFTFNHFYISSFWIGQQVQVNKHCNTCFLKRLFLLVSFPDQCHWFCQRCQSQSSIHFFSRLALAFPLSPISHIQSPNFFDLHHLETHQFRNYTYSLQNSEHFRATLNANPKQ